jgi:hypothetical protein
MYANDELFIEAVAGGERSLTRLLSKGAVAGKQLLDRVLYPLTEEQEKKCLEYFPIMQDFDEAYKCLNVLSKHTLGQIKARMPVGYHASTVITIPGNLAPPLYKYRQVTFFKVLDYKMQRKYGMVPKMASIKICGHLYVALNAVSVNVEAPIIVTITEEGRPA